MRDQRTNIARGGVPEIHHDVGVNERDLSVPNAKALEPTLIDQPPCPDTFDLLEDRSCARMNLEPRVTSSPPAQVLLHDAMHGAGITGGEPECHGESHFMARVQHAGVVAEPHVLAIDNMPTTVIIQ